MPKIIKIQLLERCRSTLTNIVRRGSNWRQRERAETILLLSDGLSTKEVADAIGVHPRTVGSTRTAWLKDGLESLSDLSRSGAPTKITPEQLDRLISLAKSEPLSARELLAKHVENGGVSVGLNTLSAALKSAGLVWKRTRHSLKKKK